MTAHTSSSAEDQLEALIDLPDHATHAGARGRVVRGAKRIRSIYLPSPTGRPPGLSTTTSFKALASLSTINGAITPWRDVFAEQTPLP